MRRKSVAIHTIIGILAVAVLCMMWNSSISNHVYAAESSAEFTITDNNSEITWNSQTNLIKIPFSCENGIYSIYFEYVPTADEATDIVANVRIDGNYPSDEFENVELPRKWIAETENYFDENGDEYAAYLVQDQSVMNEPLRDSEGLIKENLSVELDAGEHTLELERLSGTMQIRSIKLVSVADSISYADYSKGIDATEYTGEAIFIEGEDVSSRSSREIPCYSYNDISMSPEGNGKSRINAFGGSYWYKPNQSGTWTFNVPDDGLYKISLRVMQNNDGLASQRQILIDGEVHFAELEAYTFTYGRKFRSEALGGDSPYLFYLKQGEHTLTLRAVANIYADSITEFREYAKEIDALVTEVQKITGTSPDPNFDYKLEKKLPNVLEQLEKLAEEIEITSGNIEELSGENPAFISNIYADAASISDIASNPTKLPTNLGTLTTIQGDLEDAASTLQGQPLGLDWIEIQSPSEAVREPKSDILGSIKLGVKSFISSFNNNSASANDDEKTINVWVAYDKEWANVIQKLIHEDFESKYNIKVNLNVLPSGNTTVVSGASPLLLSIVAGNTPDIALGCDSRTPIELAIRGELQDISEFEDFEESSSMFRDDAVNALKYRDGVYGLPETTNMPVLVYRTDILEQNNISVPTTWEEVMKDTLPKLSQIGATFYMGSSSSTMYATMLYQMGGTIYDSEGNCMLNTPEAMAAFKQWTNMFLQYGIPQDANFYNELRTGKIPIGICSLSEYMEMKSYATELTGKIEIARLPGTESDDGAIRTDSTGSITASVMFNSAQDKDSCWAFMKWWLSDDVQTRFALEVESRVGSTGRWMSSNKAAFMNLPWNNQEAESLKESIDDFRAIPNVLGGYYSGRAITNAWTRTVFSGEDARSSLEQCYDEIETQIERKKKEYEE